MAVHKYCFTSLNLTNKAAAAGGTKLRKVVADLSLDKEMLQDALRRKL
jgi:hypothetical protein